MPGAAALAAFVALSGAVALGALASADRAILEIVQAPHERWLDFAASLVTVFGQSEIVGSIALGVAIVRRRAGRRDWWIPLLLVVVVAIEVALKLTIPQAAPANDLERTIELAPFLDLATPFSFPSGHVARVAFLVAALRWPAGVSVGILLMTVLTTIYLDHHWPSDAIGGWLLGYGVAAVADRRPRILLAA